MTTLDPPVVNDWAARYTPTAADMNTYVRDTFNFLSTPPVLRTVQTTAQSVPYSISTWTTVQLNSVQEDTYGGWTTGTQNLYTAQVSGRYGLTLNVVVAATALYVSRAGFEFNINGTTIGPMEYVRAYAGANPWVWGCYTEIHLAAGDWVKPMFLNEGNGSAVNTYVGSTGTASCFEAVWLSE